MVVSAKDGRKEERWRELKKGNMWEKNVNLTELNREPKPFLQIKYFCIHLCTYPVI